mmetsp:Transcript_23091/g.54887  ORF Transcript_23091/g.54887 Transcript_23091/m.54887 type:complete len:365 (+) Transcript_23091:66-1160(+)|eukprot:CAMPEP_0177723756 /NCGR_PEP_ID=MMETSP0484_2-20121128/18375_1 /TAXON_ID=354590 /ORGANISM="Rhodomonas lens, Strain RHODO" /LENGTH=364 /DNA_ID=CAMNT_0019236199 /DNA_START=64 /DNA_END=1158 /DNA_ORIENTATION=+
MEINTFAAKSASLGSFEHMPMKRYAPGDYDVSFDIKYSGICHTDVHLVENDFGNSQYPLVPGHEMIGVVTSAGSKVSNFKVGDYVGVGCMVDSCQECKFCKMDEEQYCASGYTSTYGGVSQYGRCGEAGNPTIGGYSDKMVVHEKFAVKVPQNAPLDRAAPLLCAGITMYEPIIHHNVGKDTKIGIVGLGGLGSMGVKIAVAKGANVTVLSTSPAKKEAALAMGASNFLVTTDKELMASAKGSLDIILDTVSADHAIIPYHELLCTDGKLVIIGINTQPFKVSGAHLIFGRHSLTGSLFGGMKRTQEMMDFCCANNVFPDIELVDSKQIMETLQKLKGKNDTAKRFVIDCSTIAPAKANTRSGG